MEKIIQKTKFIDALEKGVVVFDGATGTNLQVLNLGEKEYGSKELIGFNDALVLNAPEIIANLHRSFFNAGADVVETDTFRSNRLTLADYNLQDRTIELNRKAAQLARGVADEFEKDGRQRFVAGSIGPSGKLISTDDPAMSDITYEELADVFREQAFGLMEGGADLLLIETSQDILEVKAAVEGCKKAFQEVGFSVPIQAQVTLDVNGKMLMGTDISAVLAILTGLGVNVIGLNCSTGPAHMRPSIHYLSEHSPLPISCIPNAGLPMNVDGEAVYPMQPDEFSDALAEFVSKFGVKVVGGCCGTTPEHIRQLAEKIKGIHLPENTVVNVPALASSTQAVSIAQEPKPFIIGERLNAQGSRAFKRMVINDDYDGMVQVAHDQVDSGAHALDISMAVTERTDEVQMMQKLVKRLSLEVPVPLVIDSTEPEVIETALKTIPGRCMINSTHLESGEAKSRKLFAMAKKYSAAVLALTIDEKGMAKTAKRKLEIARRIHDLAVNEFGLRPEDLVFDSLTFTLATGEKEYRESAKATLEGLTLIKEQLPGVHTALGVSNVSFGLSQLSRKVVNSVFLFHAVRAGLDMAIVNPAHIKPYSDIPENERELAENLIFNRHENALAELISYFDARGADTDEGDGKADAFARLEAPERLRQRILSRHKSGIEEDIDEILEKDPSASKGGKAVEILNTVLLPAMKEVGDRFGAGELILPFVLQSAEVMKKAVAYLENFLEKKEGASKGRLVLATVYGDVHDIGKNLVKTILSNNGYEVIDLGKQVPAETIISTAVEEKVDAIGLSALLVSTSKQMPLIVNELQRRQLIIPVLIGGAAINPRFGWRIMQTEGGEFYKPGVFYCKDAFEGLSVMEAVSKPEDYQVLLEDTHKKAKLELQASSAHEGEVQSSIRSTPKPAESIPKPPSWGARVVESIPVQLVAERLNLSGLYRLSWGAKNTRGEAWKKLKEEYDQKRIAMVDQALQEGWLEPQAVYGYWPVQAEGNDLIFYDPETLNETEPSVLERMTFPRQVGGEGLSLADYFLSKESGQFDVVALQVVTVGPKATAKTAELEKANLYSDAYYVHGFSVQMAEAAADFLHDYIRKELGMAKGQGLRYSWGYTAIPDISDHAKVFKLLPAESALGLSLTSAYQLVPEQSTAAIVVHHPEARYFHIGINRAG